MSWRVAAATAISYGAYPVGLSGGVAVTVLLLERGPGGRAWETLVVAGVLWTASLLVLLAQPLAPRSRDWQGWGGEFRVDVLHGVLSTIGGATLARMLF